ARADAEALKEFPDVSFAVMTRSIFLEDQKQMALAFQCLEAGMRQKAVSPTVARKYVWLLFEHGKAQQAAEIVERHVPPGYRRDLLLAQMVADLGDDGYRRAQSLCDGVSGEPAEFCMAQRCGLYNILGLRDRANEALRGFKADLDQYPPGYRE